MGFGHRQRHLISLPRGTQYPSQPIMGHVERSYRLDIGIAVATVSADDLRRVKVYAVIEEAIAGQIVVDADDVWRTPVILKPCKLCRIGLTFQQEIPQRVLTIDATAEQIPPQPPSLVFEISLISK